MVTLALMNLVTALVVEDAIASARMDEDMETLYNRKMAKQMVPSLTQLFRSLDRTSDDCVELDEIVSALRDGLNIPPDLKGIVTEERVVDLFDFFDQDNDLKLSEEEFVNGMCQVAINGQSIEMTQVLHIVRKCNSQLGRIQLLLSDDKFKAGPT